MAKTFETDHVTMHAPSIRVSEEIPIDKHKIVRYDVRFKKPYIDEILYPATMHSIQHMMKAAFAEVSKVKIIDFSLMGSRTGFNLVVLDPPDNFVDHDIKGAFIVALDMDNVPGATKRLCGNYTYHDIDDAKREILEFLDLFYGIRLILR